MRKSDFVNVLKDALVDARKRTDWRNAYMTMEEYLKEERREANKEGRAAEKRDQIAALLRDGKTPEAIADFCKYPMELIKEVQESLAVARK